MVIEIVWATTVFVSFGIFAPHNSMVVLSLLIMHARLQRDSF